MGISQDVLHNTECQNSLCCRCLVYLWPGNNHSQRRRWQWRGQSVQGSWPHWCAPSDPRSWSESPRCPCQRSDRQGGTERTSELGAQGNTKQCYTGTVLMDNKVNVSNTVTTDISIPGPAMPGTSPFTYIHFENWEVVPQGGTRKCFSPCKWLAHYKTYLQYPLAC